MPGARGAVEMTAGADGMDQPFAMPWVVETTGAVTGEAEMARVAPSNPNEAPHWTQLSAVGGLLEWH